MWTQGADARLDDEAGFTLVEMLLAVVITGMIMAVISGALILTLRLSPTVTARARYSADAGILSTFMADDVANAVSPDGTEPAMQLMYARSTPLYPPQLTTPAPPATLMTIPVCSAGGWIDLGSFYQPDKSLVEYYALMSTQAYVSGGNTYQQLDFYRYKVGQTPQRVLSGYCQSSAGFASITFLPTPTVSANGLDFSFGMFVVVETPGGLPEKFSFQGSRRTTSGP